MKRIVRTTRKVVVVAIENICCPSMMRALEGWQPDYLPSWNSPPEIINYCPACGAKVEDVEEGSEPRKHIGVLDQPLWADGPTAAEAQRAINQQLNDMLEMAKPTPDPLSVACPTCFRDKGKMCDTPAFGEKIHTERIDRALSFNCTVEYAKG